MHLLAKNMAAKHLHAICTCMYISVVLRHAQNLRWCRYCWKLGTLKRTCVYCAHSQKRHRLVVSCQFYRLVNTLQQACQLHQVATSLLRSDLLQLVICRLVTTCWNNLQQACWNHQLATSLLTTCNSSIQACIKSVGNHAKKSYLA